METIIIENKGFKFKVESYTNENNQFIFKAYDIASNEEIGFLRYSIGYESYSKKAWLYNINVEEKFQGKGIGNCLLQLFEKDCANKRVDVINGKYYPSNTAAVKFYEKNRYKIIREDYDQIIHKYVDEEEIEKQYKSLLTKIIEQKTEQNTITR